MRLRSGEHRNKATSGEQCPDLLQRPIDTSLNCWLSRFVTEARREDGQAYPPSTNSGLLAGLHCNCKQYDRNFMNRKDSKFRELTGALQVRYRELCELGVGTVVKHTAVVTPDEENALWESKVIGDHDPLALQRAVFFVSPWNFVVNVNPYPSPAPCEPKFDGLLYGVSVEDLF